MLKQKAQVEPIFAKQIYLHVAIDNVEIDAYRATSEVKFNGINNLEKHTELKVIYFPQKVYICDEIVKEVALSLNKK